MPLETVFLILIALMIGAAHPFQAGLNATIAGFHGHPLWGALTNTTVATLTVSVALIVLRVPLPALGSLAQAPWWAWSGGVFGAFIVLCSLVVAPKLGAAAYVSTVIVGTVTASLVVDHFGLLVYKAQPITPWRLAGAVLVITGMMIIQWKR